jgi:hypothetical protein
MFNEHGRRVESGHERTEHTTRAARVGQPVPKRRIANRDIRAVP